MEHQGSQRRTFRALAGPLAILVTAVLLLLPQAPASANEEGTDQASLLVLQTISLIANGRDQTVVEERLSDALEAPDRSGVDMAKLQRSLQVLQGGEVDQEALDQVGEVLQGSVTIRAASGYGAIPGPGEVSGDQPAFVTGSSTGTVVVLDELRPTRGVSGGGDVVLLVLAAGSILLGLYLARRWRPHHSIHELRTLSHESETPRD